MRYCPTCETKFDEDKILFCTKDGTPLLEGSAPSFTDSMPSESVPDEDGIGEETVIRRNRPPAEDIPEQPDEDEETGSSRIVIDTASSKAAPPPPRRPASAAAVPPPPQSTGPSTGLVVFFSVLGTLIVVIGLFTIYLLLTMRSAGDANLNVNANENLNANENIEENFNADELLNLNANINTNTETPTPTPSPSPSPSPDANVNANTNVPAGTNTNTAPTPAVTPTPQPTVTATPPPASPPANVNRPVNVGTINSRAISLPLPSYPSEARQVRATGRVVVDVTLDSEGRVVDARATAGHPLLRRSAENAALRSRFEPVSVNGNRVPAKGTILYNFID